MDEILLSVVITVYNEEKYIAQCIESVINQTYQNLDIIVVDDGSTDSSPKICDGFAEKDARIRVVHKENGGSVSARKAGTKIARGLYITYVDGDDFITDDLYNTVMSDILDKNISDVVDIYAYSLTCFYEDGSIQIIKNSQLSGIYTGNELEKLKSRSLYFGELGKFGLFPSMCSKIYRKNLIEENLDKVTDGIRMGDDGACTYPSICDSNIVIVNNEPAGYMYRQVKKGTQTTTYSFDEFYRIEDLFHVLHSAFEKRNTLYMYSQLGYYLVFLYRTEMIHELSHIKISNFRIKYNHLHIIKKLDWIKYMTEHLDLRDFNDNKELLLLINNVYNPLKLMFSWYSRRLFKS